MQEVSEEAPFSNEDADSPTISTVVIGRNEGVRLAKCLDSIVRVRDVDIKEIIYVDSASTDGSPELASRYGVVVLVVRPSRPTAAIGRNAGWRRADSDLVLFLDGDTVLHPDFLGEAFEVLLREPSVAAVWGHRREIHPEASLFNRVLDLDWVYRPGFTEFCGGDVLMRRRALVETGGFDERLIAGEEPELCRRMRARGYRILHIDYPMTGHDLQITNLRQYWRRATRAGHAYAEVSERYRDSNDRSWASERTGNLLRGSFWPISLAIVILACSRFGLFPLALWLTLLLLLSIRSAWKARWKTRSQLTLLLYGVHSHLQQVPILVGQLQYQLSKIRGKAQRLIEYKEKHVD